MTESNRKNVIVKALPLYLFLMALLSVSLWAIWQRRVANGPVEVGNGGILSESLWDNPEDTGSQAVAINGVIVPVPPVDVGAVEAEAVPVRPDESVVVTPGVPLIDLEAEKAAAAQKAKKAALEKIIAGGKQWDAVGANWFGKDAADFSFRSIDDEKIRKLSDYRGKDVILAFWATYCPPCLIEIPELIHLRDSISEDDLEIIAITTEDAGMIKNFAAQKGINYTVTSVQYQLPSPFSFVSSIPTSFYINEDGKIEFIAVGVVSAEEVKAILALSD
jgi:peroxiredoxin